jgi:hypothetical protein
MANPYSRLLALLPQRPLQVGTVVDVTDGTVSVELPGGAIVQVRGDAGIGDNVFIRDGVIEGPAPSNTITDIEV